MQFLPCPAVPVDVLLELLLPESSVCLRCTGVLAPLVPVPIAPIYENRRPVLRKDQVGAARQVPVIHAIPEPQPMQAAAQNPFRFRIRTPDLGHRLRPLPCRHRVSQAVLPSSYSCVRPHFPKYIRLGSRNEANWCGFRLPLQNTLLGSVHRGLQLDYNVLRHAEVPAYYITEVPTTAGSRTRRRYPLYTAGIWVEGSGTSMHLLVDLNRNATIV